jgi:hypothetical protein
MLLASQANKARYVSREEYQVKRGASSYSTVGASGGVLSTPIKGKSPSIAATLSGTARDEDGDNSSEFRMPDWTSTDPDDWRFYGSRGVSVAPVTAAATLGASRTPYLSKSVSISGV